MSHRRQSRSINVSRVARKGGFLPAAWASPEHLALQGAPLPGYRVHQTMERLRRHIAEQQIDSAIDQLAQKVPGGTQYTQQAKDAASGVLDKLEGELEQEAEKRLGNLGGMLGGLFGHHQDKQDN